ncbi:hypothetical protein FRB94_008053 [Tulasnella sp. JGI-2019a]|nr:hypothetical protein FRB94_008053 [Tulasnella sp. JGI-2019a]
MFDIPRPVVGENGENDDTFDGVLLMELGDKTKDIRALFRMIYDGPPQDVPFDLIESVLRVSSKYEIEQYQAWAISCLKKYILPQATL